MPKRNLTVGVTVNLKNYESLRLEVQDEVESEEDVRSLVAFLDETLALFGQGNRETEKVRRPLPPPRHAGRRGRGHSADCTLIGRRRETCRCPDGRAGCRAPRARTGCNRAARGGAGTEACAESRSEARSEGAGEDTVLVAHGRRLRGLRRARERGREKTSRLFVSKTLCKKCIQSL